MPKKTTKQRGAIPFIVLVIVVPILLIICFVIIFSTGGLNVGGGTTKPQVQTPKPEPTYTPKPKSQAEYIKIDLTVDLERTKKVYCYYENADTIKAQSEKLKLELQKSAVCLSSYDKYADDKSQKLNSCTNGCKPLIVTGKQIGRAHV